MLAFPVRLTAMQLPFTQRGLRVEPADLPTFLALAGLALSILLVMDIHTWWWTTRRRRITLTFRSFS